VVKIMDYGKFKYEAAQKAKEARRNQANTVLKEVRFRLKIEAHDYTTKLKRAEGFLQAGDKVKAMILFRGREQSRPSRVCGCCASSPRTSPSSARSSRTPRSTDATWSW
jgi:translation initiation factor IF-3